MKIRDHDNKKVGKVITRTKSSNYRLSFMVNYMHGDKTCLKIMEEDLL